MIQTQRNSLNRNFIGSNKNNLSKSFFYWDSYKNEFNQYKKKLKIFVQELQKINLIQKKVSK